MVELTEIASKHAKDIIQLAIKHGPSRKALIVFDARSPLSRIVTTAYRSALPEARLVDFDASSPAEIMAEIEALSPGDLTVMIQSTDFRLNEFRFRIELFKRELAVIEHVHLERARSEAELAIYVDAMAYDPAYYLPLGRAIKKQIDGTEMITVRCADTLLTYEGGMEEAKLNIGDYAGMKNVGGTFPIGEVFSEPRDLTKVNGEVRIFGFAGVDHLVQIHEPFKARIDQGILTAENAPAAFNEVLDQIRAEEAVLVREFGIGLNPAMGKDRVLSDITAFERQRGLHLSLGEKHGVYKKPGFIPKKTRYHVDVFVDVQEILIDGRPLSY